jgi:hypothetical protein
MVCNLKIVGAMMSLIKRECKSFVIWSVADLAQNIGVAININ